MIHRAAYARALYTIVALWSSVLCQNSCTETSTSSVSEYFSLSFRKKKEKPNTHKHHKLLLADPFPSFLVLAKWRTVDGPTSKGRNNVPHRFAERNLPVESWARRNEASLYAPPCVCKLHVKVSADPHENQTKTPDKKKKKCFFTQLLEQSIRIVTGTYGRARRIRDTHLG